VERRLPLSRHIPYPLLLAFLIATSILHASAFDSEHLGQIDCDDQVCAQCQLLQGDWSLIADDSQSTLLMNPTFSGGTVHIRLRLPTEHNFYARAPPAQ
jgi:hypothetical protein